MVSTNLFGDILCFIHVVHTTTWDVVFYIYYIGYTSLWSILRTYSIDHMNPYSGTSTLAKVLRAAAVGGGVLYGSIKLGYLKV